MIPIKFFGYLILTKRYLAACLSGILLLLLSLGLSSLAFGVDESVEAHFRYPEQIRQQEPARSLGNEVPISFTHNQSPAACIISISNILSNPLALVLRYCFLAGTSLVVAWIVYRFGNIRDYKYVSLTLWLSWTILAAPFSRYYYLLFVAPSWVLAATMSPGVIQKNKWLFAAIPIFSLASRNSEVFVPILLVTFTLAIVPFLNKKTILFHGDTGHD